MATPAGSTAVSRNRVPVRVKLDASIMKKIIESDSHLDVSAPDDTAKRSYEHNCNLRELETYNLLKKMVFNMNELLKSRQERIRLIEEGDGLYIELD